MGRFPIGVWLSFAATAVLAFVLATAGVTIGEVFACMLGALVTLLVMLVFVLWMDQPRRVQRRQEREATAPNPEESKP